MTQEAPEMLCIRNEQNQKSKSEEKEKRNYLQITPDAPLVRVRKIFSGTVSRCTKRTYVVYDAYTFADSCCKTVCSIWVYGVYGSNICLDESILEMAMRPVSVRVEDHVLDELDVRAKSLGKKDRSAHLRDLIIDNLTMADKAESASPEMKEVREEIRMLRVTIQNGVMGLMLMIDKTFTPEKAEKWVKENL